MGYVASDIKLVETKTADEYELENGDPTFRVKNTGAGGSRVILANTGGSGQIEYSTSGLDISSGGLDTTLSSNVKLKGINV